MRWYPRASAPPRQPDWWHKFTHTLHTFTRGIQPHMQPTGTKPFNSSSVHPLFIFSLSIHLLYKHICSCQCSSCWFCFFYCWCLNLFLTLCSFILSIFPLFFATHIVPIKNSQLFHVLQSCACAVTYGFCSATGVTHSCFTEIIYVVTDLSHVLPETYHTVYVALHDFLSLLHLW